jgi:hypothetical protein
MIRVRETPHRRLWPGSVILAAIIEISAPVSGVVLMHGSTDSPSGSIALLATAMESRATLLSSRTCAGHIGAGGDRPFLDWHAS